MTGTATDGAGNSATDSASVNIDKTDPTVGASVSGTMNAAGWYNDDVTVSFTATDDRSGVASKSGDTVLGEGRNQSATGSATDALDGSAGVTVNGINAVPRLPC